MVFAGMISVGAFTAAGSLTFNCFASLEQVVQQLCGRRQQQAAPIHRAFHSGTP